ncbi:hypothetical protein EVAR_61314_1 [Eumeta japonica]|uniref:Uncharacterized protein n=1 Tax=Eumeta variegata TaxID=151549 RepID=A0A4C2A744_EUMVA|nr:hypothetical protein EVAR_61314_1 [Eumeta japonica]
MTFGWPGRDYRIPVSLVPANLQWLKLNESGEQSTRLDALSDKYKRSAALFPPRADEALIVVSTATNQRAPKIEAHCAPAYYACRNLEPFFFIVFSAQRAVTYTSAL